MSLHLKSLELNNKVLENIQITSQENMILKSMENFYTHDININLFLNIISVESSISIRLIDYFVTKYSKLHKISYKYNDETINVYTSYKQHLKAFQKKHFDPFEDDGEISNEKKIVKFESKKSKDKPINREIPKRTRSSSLNNTKVKEN